MTARQAQRGGSPAVQHVEVALTDIVRDPAYQVRKGTDPATVARYVSAMRAGQQFPPIRVGIVGGAWVLLDGWHRMAAMEEACIHRATVEAVKLTEAEARWAAAEANMRHGLQLTRSELRSAFRVFIRTGQHRRGQRFLSLRDIAKAFGVTHPTIRTWLHHDFPKTAQRMAVGDHGGNGGSRSLPPAEERRARQATRLVHEAAANARGIHCPRLRGELVRDLEEALREIREAAPWEPPGATAF